MKISGSPKHSIELDGLRGVACLQVLMHHYFTGVLAIPLSGVSRFVDTLTYIFLESGVDLFFVLSGFLVGGIIIDHHDTPNFLKTFYIRRVCRIFPAYFVLIFSLALGLYFLKDVGFFKLWLLETPLPLWSYFVFLQSYLMGLANASGPKWAAISWSVSVEEQFYFLFPMVFLLFRKRGAVMLVLFGLLAAPLLRAYFTRHLGFYAGYMFFPGRMDTIFWGVGLAFVLRDKKLRSVLLKNSGYVIAGGLLLLLVIAGSSFSLYQLDIFYRFTLLGLFYAFIIWAIMEKRFLLLNRMLASRFLVFTGLISYGLYLVHQLVNGLMHGLFYHSKPLIDGWGRAGLTLASVLVAYGISYLSLRYFERPIRNFGRRFHYAPGDV